MSWEDRHLPGEFKGVPFHTRGHSMTGGRNAVAHEFAGRDDIFVEDIEKKARSFSLPCFVVGNDYDIQRNALINAAESEGKGTLIHPYIGRIEAYCRGYTLNEDMGSTRTASITLQFYQEQDSALKERVDEIGALQALATRIRDIANSNFTENFSVEGFPQFAKDDTLTVLGDAMDGVDAVFDSANFAINKAAEITKEIRDFRRDVERLIATPAALAARLSGVFDLFMDAVDFGETAKKTSTLYNFGDSRTALAGVVTPTLTAQNVNRDAIDRIVKMNTVANAAYLGAKASENSETGFDAISTATAYANELKAEMNEILLATSDDDVADAITDTSNAVDATIPPEENALAKIKYFKIDSTIPSVLFAHEVTGSADADRAICQRNGYLRPLFMPIAQEHEVLT